MAAINKREIWAATMAIINNRRDSLAEDCQKRQFVAEYLINSEFSLLLN